MATRIYAVRPGAPFELNSVIENVGPAATSAPINLIVDLATNIVTEGATTRGILKSELLLAIENLKAAILADTWPPA